MKLPTLPKMPMCDYSRPCIEGQIYSLYRATDGNYWLEHSSGEGMHVSRTAIEKMLMDFYKENF